MTRDGDSPQNTSIGEMDFYVDEVSIGSREGDPSSDVGHVEALLKKSGYSSWQQMRYLRLVHLLDADKRKELMIIYAEKRVAPAGSIAGLLKRAKSRVQIRALRASDISHNQR